MRFIPIDRTDCSMPNDESDYPFMLNIDAITGYRELSATGLFTSDVMIFAPIPTKFGGAIWVTREKWEEILKLLSKD